MPGLATHNVFTVIRGGKKIDDLLGRGIRLLEAIPEETMLTDRQAVQVASVRSGMPWKSPPFRPDWNLSRTLDTS
jgi:hypothetical protein